MVQEVAGGLEQQAGQQPGRSVEVSSRLLVDGKAMLAGWAGI
jgi:hypothetical protein